MRATAETETCCSSRFPQAAIGFSGLALESNEEGFMLDVRRIGAEQGITLAHKLSVHHHLPDVDIGE
jgi:hypothetical protein